MSWKRTFFAVFTALFFSQAIRAIEPDTEYDDGGYDFNISTIEPWGHVRKHAPPHLLSASEIQDFNSVSIYFEQEGVGWAGEHQALQFELDHRDQSARKTLDFGRKNLWYSRCEIPGDRQAYKEVMALLQTAVVSSKIGQTQTDSGAHYSIDLTKKYDPSREGDQLTNLLFLDADESALSDFFRFLRREFQEKCPPPAAGPLFEKLEDFSRLQRAIFSFPGSDRNVVLYLDHKRKRADWTQEPSSPEAGMLPESCLVLDSPSYAEARVAFLKARIELRPDKKGDPSARKPHRIVLDFENFNRTELALSDHGKKGLMSLTGLQSLEKRASEFKKKCGPVK